MTKSFKKIVAWVCAATLLVAGMTVPAGNQIEAETTADGWVDASGTWTEDGVWNIGVFNGGVAKYQNNDTLNDYYVNVVTGAGDWSVQTNTIVTGLTAGKIYNYTITIESDKEGAYVGAKDDYSNSTLVYKTLSVGENTIEGTFTAAQANAKLFLEMGNGANSGATFHITNVEVEEYVASGEQSGNIVAGKTWTGWFEAEGWASYTISDDPTTYTLTNKNIATNWYSIQTGIDNVEFLANTDYTCTFTLTTTAPKQFKVDNRSNDATIFTEPVAGTWTDNGDGTYSYKYYGTYASTTASIINVRVSLGHFGDADANFAASSTITCTLSDFQIIKSSEYEGEEPTSSTDSDTGVANVAVTATANAAGQIAASWAHPNVEYAQERYYLNKAGEVALDEGHYAKAANGWVWSISNPTELREALDSVTSTNDDSISTADGGNFVIVVQYIDADGTVVAQGTSNVVTVVKNTNKDLALFVERYEAANMLAYLKWTAIGGAAKYVAYDADGNVAGESTGDWASVKVPARDQDYTYTVKAYDADNNEIADITNNTAIANISSWVTLGGATGYSYHCDTVENVVNVQQPGFATELGVYMHGNGGISTVTINGVVATDGVECKIDGAGVVVYLTSLTKNINEIVIGHAGGEVTVKIKNDNVAPGEEEPTTAVEEPTTPVEEPTTPSTTEWKAIDGGTGYYYDTDTVENIVNIQTPGFATAEGIYMHGDGGISTVTINGVAASDGVECEIEGAGLLVYLTSLTKNVNEIVIGHAGGEVTVRIKNDNVPADEEPVEDKELEIDGYQIAASNINVNGKTYSGGVRTNYIIDKAIVEEAEEVGLVYGFYGKVDADKVTIDNTDGYVAYKAATDAGILTNYANDGYDATTETAYGMIMASNLKSANANAINQKYYVRVYAKYADGSVDYSEVVTYSTYDVAEVAYNNVLMGTEAGHNYLFDLLKKVKSDYTEVPFVSKDASADAE